MHVGARALIKSMFGRLGYDVRRLPTGPAFSSQKRLLRDRDVSVIFDCGAYVGDTVARYRRLFPTARIYGFEPQLESFELLQRRHGMDQRTSLHPIALTDRRGTTEFYPNAWPTFSSVLEPAPSMHRHRPDVPPSPPGPILVPTTTLDAFCAERRIERLPILKIDVQGAELTALHGAPELLQRRAIDLIYTEVNFVTLYEGQAHFCDLLAHLASFDYVLYGLYDLGFEAGGFLSHADAIFLSPSVAARALLAR